MSQFGKDIDPNVGVKFPIQDPTKGGRKPSIRNQLKEILLAQGKLKIPAENVLSVEDDGSVIIKMPTEMQLAMKLKQIAMSGKNNNTLKAIQMIMEQIDGKPIQTINQDSTVTINDFDITKLYKTTDKEME